MENNCEAVEHSSNALWDRTFLTSGKELSVKRLRWCAAGEGPLFGLLFPSYLESWGMLGRLLFIPSWRCFKINPQLHLALRHTVLCLAFPYPCLCRKHALRSHAKAAALTDHTCRAGWKSCFDLKPTGVLT